MKRLYYFTIQKIIPKTLALFFKQLLHLLFKTCRLEITGLDHLKKTKQTHPCILALWHSRLAIAAEILKKCAPEYLYAALVSKSRDGEILSTVVESYAQAKAIRVSHIAKFAALKDAIDEVVDSKRILIITPDGPKGPAKKLKPGLAKAQSLSQAAVIPLSWSASKTFRLSTWDKMEIPKPFSTIKIAFGSPIFDASNKALEEGFIEVEASLN